MPESILKFKQEWNDSLPWGITGNSGQKSLTTSYNVMCTNTKKWIQGPQKYNSDKENCNNLLKGWQCFRMMSKSIKA